MKNLVFGIIQTIVAFIFPAQVAEFINSYIPTNSVVAGNPVPTEEVSETPPPTVTATRIAPPAPFQDADKIKMIEVQEPSSEEIRPLEPPLSLGESALNHALSKIGAPYVWGAEGPWEFDCSGLVQWAYAQEGITLPRVSEAQMYSGRAVMVPELGDLVVSNGGGHIGLYAGNGMIVHSPMPGDVVKLSPMSYFDVVTIRRI